MVVGVVGLVIGMVVLVVVIGVICSSSSIVVIVDVTMTTTQQRDTFTKKFFHYQFNGVSHNTSHC